MLPHRLDLDFVEHLANESLDQKSPGRRLVEAAGAQIEDRVLVELADRSAVRALDVVGVNLELGLGIDLGLGGQQQVLVALVGVGVLGVGPDLDLALEDPVGGFVEYALVVLAADAVRLGVVDPGGGVEMLAPAPEIDAAPSPSRATAISLRTKRPPVARTKLA
jgi:hypothetical protein